MVELRNRDIKTVYKVMSSSITQLTVGGQVPAGMKRWVTFLAVDSIMLSRASGIKAYFTSVGVSNPTKASLIATTYRKLGVAKYATQMSRVDGFRPVCFPLEGPNPNAPLFSIASGKWLGVYASYTTVGVFVQYFDE